MNQAEVEARKLKKWRENARKSTIRPAHGKGNKQSTLHEAGQ
jgi:hypothetical protein